MSGDYLALTVPGWSKYHQALYFQPGKLVKVLADHPMVPVDFVLWHGVGDKVNQAIARPSPG